MFGNRLDRIASIAGLIDVMVNSTFVQPILETSSQSFRYSILTAMEPPPQDLSVTVRCEDYMDPSKSILLSNSIPVYDK